MGGPLTCLRRRAAISALLALLAVIAATPSLRAWALPPPPATAPASFALALWRVQAAGEPILIKASRSIAVPSGEDIPLPIEVGPADAIPRNSFVRIRGLPQGAMLSEGFGIAAGLWAVPLNGLPKLRMRLGSPLAGETRLTLSLVTVDGKVHAETTVALLPTADRSRSAGLPRETASTGEATAPRAGGEAKPAVPPPMGAPAGADLAQAKALHAQGNQKLASGNIAAARMFYRRAAEAGFADAAFALAATYDPEELSRLKVVGLRPDVAAARHWYERAHALGFKGAEERLSRLGLR
ncbi:MAG TPA: hypothetical protein VNK52_00250 [Hyphomicrobiaceae bacterium]|nr:hypothetical protein [Hyphomicrobiaceae bacterium]